MSRVWGKSAEGNIPRWQHEEELCTALRLNILGIGDKNRSKEEGENWWVLRAYRCIALEAAAR